MIKKIDNHKINKILRKKNRKKNKLSDILKTIEKIINNKKINGKNFYL